MHRFFRKQISKKSIVLSYDTNRLESMDFSRFLHFPRKNTTNRTPPPAGAFPTGGGASYFTFRFLLHTREAIHAASVQTAVTAMYTGSEEKIM